MVSKIERLKILKMVERGVITASEGARLLAVLGGKHVFEPKSLPTPPAEQILPSTERAVGGAGAPTGSFDPGFDRRRWTFSSVLKWMRKKMARASKFTSVDNS